VVKKEKNSLWDFGCFIVYCIRRKWECHRERSISSVKAVLNLASSGSK
jgi:hypothetical protein